MNTPSGEKDKMPPKGKRENGFKNISRKISITALLSAALIVGKYVIHLIPFIEVVTIFVIVFTCVFGWRMTAAAVNIFCALDPVIFPDTISYPSIIAGYFIYWNLLCFLTYALYAGGLRSPVIYALFAFFMRFLFGIILAGCATLIEGLLFLPLYTAGLLFDAIYMVSSFAVVLLLYKPLLSALGKLYASYK